MLLPSQNEVVNPQVSWNQLCEQVRLAVLIKTRTSLDDPVRDQLSLITESLFNDGLYRWDGV